MRSLKVSEFVDVVNLLLKETLSTEVFCVEGEVSGYRVSQGQWVSFDLKDDKALVNIFMPVWNLRVPIEDGMCVRVFGLPRIYPKYGKFSISADRIEPVGEGALKKALALLRLKLEKEGLFEPSRKRELPRFPQRIALVASKESAAYGDFVRVMGERWGGVIIDVYHVLVQGERAPREIVAAIQSAQRDDYDVLVMTRGGGSLEELMAFNDEQVVRALHASKIPTLVAIGHERDLTLAEEAADVRGSTPTDCARRLVPDRRDVEYELATLISTVENGLKKQIEIKQTLIERALNAPTLWLSAQRMRFEQATGTCDSLARQWLLNLENRLSASIRLLSSLDPKSVLARGYAILRNATGQGVSSISQLTIGESASIVLRDGEAGVTIARTGKGQSQQTLL